MSQNQDADVRAGADAPPPPSPPSPPAPPTTPAAQPPARKPWLFSGVLVIGALIAIGLVLKAWNLPPFSSDIQTTDNAYVRGQVTVISPQVSGAVTEVLVKDFESVTEGQVLAQIDDRIYRQRLEEAQALLHAAKAQLASADPSRASAVGNVARTHASIAAAEANVTKARADFNRAKTLFEGGWVAQAQVDVTRTALTAAEAELNAARAAEDIAKTGVTSSEVNREALVAAVEQAEAKVHLAEIDLANTRILAPAPGRLGEITMRRGQQVQQGSQMATLVPEVLWVTANFKENQMRTIRVGQTVRLSVDALGGQELTGRVEQISPATGAEFSVIQPDNATGNFTKVAQRVPVRIALDPGQAGLDRLRPGLSVVAKVDTSSQP